MLDSSVVLAAERGQIELADVAGDEDDVAIAAVTAAELLLGAFGAVESRRRVRVEYVESLLARLPVEVYDLTVARSHAELLAFTRASGTRRGAHDLIIAASAAAHRRIVVTRDRLGFGGLPGVEVRIV